MSAINVLVQDDAVHLATDGLSYIDGIPCEVALNKTHVLRGMRAALSATGPAGLGGFIAERLERDYKTFDELVKHGSNRIKELFHEYVDAYRDGDAVSTLMLIGWHEEENRPAAYGIDMETAGTKADWVNANNPHPAGFGLVHELTELKAGSVPCPTLVLCKSAGYDLLEDNNAKNAEKDSLHLLEMQRRMTVDGVSYVGGQAMLTTVTAKGVTQRVLHRWDEDKLGKMVKPAEIDWAAWRTERATADMSWLKRKMLLKKMRNVA
jgi:hypothetical protein